MIKLNLYIEFEGEIAFVMADTKNDFAISDSNKQLTEQWTECRKK